MPQGAGVLRAE